MCQAIFVPNWNLGLSHQEMRTISLALSGRIKPDTPDALLAAKLLKSINDQRIKRLHEMTDILEGMDATLDVD